MAKTRSEDRQRYWREVSPPAPLEALLPDRWVDPDTKLPIRIEVEYRSTHPMSGQSDWVVSDLIWDAPLDRSLFSTTPPEGYKEAK
jgi:hypothetical protein